MKAYIQSHENGIPHNYNFMNAYQGFYEMGFEVIPFHDNERFQESKKEDIVVGYVGTTGNSTGAHLHFELYLNGARVTPDKYVMIN